MPLREDASPQVTAPDSATLGGCRPPPAQIARDRSRRRRWDGGQVQRAVTIEDAGGAQVCGLLAELAAAIPIAAWCVAGDVMTAIHAGERGVPLPPMRPAEAMEIVVDTRSLPHGADAVSEALAGIGFAGIRAGRAAGAAGAHAGSGVRRRYERRDQVLDAVLLGGSGRRSGRHAEPAGSDPWSQAILRAGPVNLACPAGIVTLRRPALLGALLLESGLSSTAPDEGDVVAARRALAFLLTLVDEPMVLRTQMRADESRQLRRQAALLDPDHPAWLAMEGAEAGRRSLRLLSS